MTEQHKQTEEGSISFDADSIGASSPKFVLWLDVMGIKEKMSRSLAQSANFIAKFHVAVQRASHRMANQPSIYSAMDGAYILFDNGAEAKDFIQRFFSHISQVFAKAKPKHQFLVRGGLAYGNVYETYSILPALSKADGKLLAGIPLVIGFAVIQAHLAEKDAPPFGIFIHETAREVGSNGVHLFSGSWYRWFGAKSPNHLRSQLNRTVANYFKWCREHCLEIGYDIKALERHELSAMQYFSPF